MSNARLRAKVTAVLAILGLTQAAHTPERGWSVGAAQAQAQDDGATESINISNRITVRMLSRGQHAAALSLAAQTLKRAQATLAENNPAALNALNNYAVALESLGRVAEALPQHERALRLRADTLGEKHPDTHQSMHNLAHALKALGRAAEALPHFERVYKLRTELFGEKHRDTLTSLDFYAGTLDDLGRAAEAVPHFERALRLRTEVFGEKHPATLLSINNYAGILATVGRRPEALALYVRSLELHTAILGEKHPNTLIALNNYASALQSAGQSAQALVHYERALKLNTQVLGEKHRNTINSHNNYAYALQAVGRTAEALPHFERALSLRTELLGEKHPTTLGSVNNYAAALQALGRTSEALQYYESVARMRSEVLGEKHPDTLLSLSNYAVVLQSADRVEEALPHSERVLKLRSEVLGDRHPATYQSLNNHAHALHVAGRLPEALRYAETALKTGREVMGEKHPDTLTSLNNYAEVLRDLGRTSDALPNFERVLRLSTEVLGEMHPRNLVALNNYAYALRTVHRAPDALRYHERFVAGAEAQRDQAGRDSAESQRGVLSSFLYGYHSYLLALKDTGRIRDAFAILERTKARTLLEQMALRSAATGSGLPEAEAGKLIEYANRIGALDTRIAQAAKEPERDALKADRNTLSRTLAELKNDLQQRYPRFRQITEVQLAGAGDARSLLPANGIFVSYVVMGGGAVMAMTLNSSGEVAWFDAAVLPGLADTIEALRMWSASQGARALVDDAGRAIQIQRWMDGKHPRWRVVTASQACSTLQMQQDRLRTEAATRGPQLTRGLDVPAASAGNAGADCLPPGASLVRSAEQYQELLDYIGKILLDPVKSQLMGKQQVIISPDGPLGLVPWDVLPLDGKPLIAQFDVSQVQSLSVLKLLKARQAEYVKSGSGEALLAMGNPEYGGGTVSQETSVVTRSPLVRGDDPAQKLRNMKWVNLPGTQNEMDRAARLFSGHSRVVGGKAASETMLRSLSSGGELAKYRYLLFAAHGYFDPNFPAYSSLVLAPEGPESERDGYVTMGEWVGMNLKSELTLLSACNTARGENISGEGLMGLAYALYVAGNTNTVLTLWPVADEETAEFVSSLLTKIKAGQPHAQAITATKREFLNHDNPRKRSPYFWAPFVLYGM